MPINLLTFDTFANQGLDENDSCSVDFDNTKIDDQIEHSFKEENFSAKEAKQYNVRQRRSPSAMSGSSQYSKSPKKDKSDSAIRSVFSSKNILIGVLIVLLGASVIVNIYIAL